MPTVANIIRRHVETRFPTPTHTKTKTNRQRRDYTEQVETNGLVPSFGRVGDSYDNALAETINGIYKAECVGVDGPFSNLAEVMDATLAWVDWYNTRRLHGYLGYHTPVEAETHYYQTGEPLT
jgi:transposase InsO family protein